MAPEADWERWGPHADAPAVRTVSAMLEAERLPHALLIVGPVGVGKRDLAVRIAQAMLCDESSMHGSGPCRDCRTCRRLHDPAQPQLDPQHTDVEIVSPGSLCADPAHDHGNTRTIGICVIRRIEHMATLTPFEADRRLLIVDPAESMTSDAADAFLKTLEEPPPNVHFILLTAQEALLSETIRSRCRRLTVSPLGDAQVQRWMDAWQSQGGPSLPDDAARRSELQRLARGRPGWLERALRTGDPLAIREAQIDDAVRLAAASRAERFQWTEQAVGRGLSPQAFADLDQILDAWSDWWRDLWLSSEGQSDAIVHVTQGERIERTAAMYDQQSISQFVERIEQTRQLIHRGVNARLALDVLLLRIPSAS